MPRAQERRTGESRVKERKNGDKEKGADLDTLI